MLLSQILITDSSLVRTRALHIKRWQFVLAAMLLAAVLMMISGAAGRITCPVLFLMQLDIGIGNALNFGGPYVGLFATKQKYLRQMPGRLSGMTVDAEARSALLLAGGRR